jgi:putative membrane protein
LADFPAAVSPSTAAGRRCREIMSRMARHPGWLDEGEEPDYRYSLANERTYLAWSRTALSLLAGAVAIDQLATNFGSAGTRKALGVVLAIGGLTIAALSYSRWTAVERAMRRSAKMPFPWLVMVLSVALTLAAVGVLLIVITG